MTESQFSAALARIGAGRLVVLLDACHSAGAGTLKGAIGNEPLLLDFGEKSLASLAQGTGRVLIASSRASETSLVMAGAHNSLFTQHLLDALKGHAPTQGDGLIRVFEVFNYVAEMVRRAAPGRQHPIFKASDLEDNFPIALHAGGTKGPPPSQQSTGSANDVGALERILSDLYPLGPEDQEIWTRAGGDLSRLRLSGTGRSKWFAALRTLSLGGGGAALSRESLVAAALEEFPHHPELLTLA
jgi:hypothetical protein